MYGYWVEVAKKPPEKLKLQQAVYSGLISGLAIKD